MAALPHVREEVEGAAPDELVLYACDMFPFRRRIADPENWLAREDVRDYLAVELVPAMVEAYGIESDVWGFTWYEAWTSYRPGQDAERLSVALSDGETWFHGRAPTKGHGGISMTSMDNAQYDSLIDAHMSLFYHELFHNLQRNINLRVGGDGEVSGADGAWRFFSEGTAVLASSVGLPDVELARTTVPRSYRAFASLFPLDESYEEMDPYRAALYWRFLYEQCGGVTTGRGEPGRRHGGHPQCARRALWVGGRRHPLFNRSGRAPACHHGPRSGRHALVPVQQLPGQPHPLCTSHLPTAA